MALGCQETVQTLLEWEFLKSMEAASDNPDCNVKSNEAQGVAACLGSVDKDCQMKFLENSPGCGRRKGETAQQENANEVEYQEENWQQQSSTKEDPGTLPENDRDFECEEYPEEDWQQQGEAKEEPEQMESEFEEQHQHGEIRQEPEAENSIGNLPTKSDGEHIDPTQVESI